MELENLLSLKDKVVLVTGGSGGMGIAISKLLATAGATVVVHYHNHSTIADQLVAGIRASGGSAFSVQADVTDPADIRKMIDLIMNDKGSVDILVNNAGITRDRTLAKMTDDEWLNVIQVNLTGAYHCAKAVLPGMLQKGRGKIIFTSSIIGQRGGIGQSNYAASKAGMIGFAKSLALELARKNVQVNCVAPGFTDTPMLDSIPPDIREKIINDIPMKRLAAPEDIAKTILYLASSMSDMVTGQVIAVNGGHYL